MCRDTWAHSERESHTRSSLNHLYVAFVLAFLASHFDLRLVLGPYLIYVRDSPCVYTSLSQNRFQQRGLWVDLTSPLWPPRSFLSERSPWLKMRNMWSLILYQGGAQPPLLIVLLLIFWSFFPQRMKSNYSLSEGPSTSGLKTRLNP